VLAVGEVEIGILAEAVTGLLALADHSAPLPVSIGAGAAELVQGLADGGPAGPIGVLETAAVVGLAGRLPGRRSPLR
jgi:hypothetical protein